jgi:hypothetical protein
MASESGMTLTQLAYFGRIGVKVTIFCLVSLMVGRTFWSAFSAYWRAAHPTPPPPPTAGFGILPTLRFPQKSDSEKPNTYQLQTANGAFPKFGDRAKVFLMPKSAPSLLSDNQAKQMASTFGFVFAPTVLNDRTYRWSKSQPLQSTLEMDIQSFTFSLTTNYLSVPDLFSKQNLPSDKEAATSVRSFLSSGFTLPSDIATSAAQISFLKANGNDVSPAVSFSDADFLAVDIMRDPIDAAIPMYTPDGRKGIVHAVLSGGLTGKSQIVQLDYHYHPVNYSSVETYGLRSPQSAWQVMQSGEGYVANKGTGSGAGAGTTGGSANTAVIRTVSLGYYDDYQEQDYLQPIYVFEGDGGFLGYVPAVDPRFVARPGVAATPQK